MKTLVKIRCGFTLIELMVTMLIALLVIAGIGVAMVDSIRALPGMYERTTGNYQRADAGVIPDAYVTRATFDSICRKASRSSPTSPYFSTSGITVYFYSSMTAPTIDSSAVFAYNAGNKTLTVSYGDGVGGNLGPPVTLANNVTAANFAVQGSSVLMAITIDNVVDPANPKQKMKMIVTSAAVRHNE